MLPNILRSHIPSLLLNLAAVLVVHAVPTSLPNSNGAGIIPVTFEGSKFRGSFLVGGQPMKLTMDTGSAPFWVRWAQSPYHDNYYNASANGLYNITCPSTTSPLCYQDSWSIDYGGTNLVTGNYRAIDSVSAPQTQLPALLSLYNLATQSKSGLSIRDQQIRLVSSDTRTDTTRPAGMCGLSFTLPNTNINKIPSKTLWENHPSRFFSIHTPGNNTSSWYFGIGVNNTSHYSGSLSYIPRTIMSSSADFYWHVNVSSTVLVNNKVIPMSTSSGYNLVLLDTGTAPTYLPPTTVSSIYSQLYGGNCNSNQYAQCYFNCTYYQSNPFPIIKLPWSGNRWITMNMDAGVFYQASEYNLKTGKCVGAIQRSLVGATSSVYGTAVYKSAFFLFDGGEKGDGSDARVEIAPYKSSGGGGGSSITSPPVQMATRRPVSTVTRPPVANPTATSAAPNPAASGGSSPIANQVNACLSKAMNYVNSLVKSLANQGWIKDKPANAANVVNIQQYTHVTPVEVAALTSVS